MTEAARLQTVVITGVSGAGRSTAAKVFEDLGYYVVDNLPADLVGTMVDLGSRSHGAVTRLAMVLDVRSRALSPNLRGVVAALGERADGARVVFLDASDDVLVRRYESVRRAHPMQADGRLIDGIAAERALLAPLREEADLLLDTSNRSVHELRRAIETAFGDATATGGPPALLTTVLSFGFKYGLPVDADLVVDVRFIPNPYWVPELRELTGNDAAVRDYVLGQQDVKTFLDSYTAVLDIITAGYRREGKRYLTLAVGCTGGKHRSVVMAHELAGHLITSGVPATVQHRDLGRE